MSEGTAVETKYCSNCKKDIAAANFAMHEVHCRRYLVLCEHCQEPVPRTELDQHFTDVHAKVPCSQCSVELEKDHLDAHLENDCPKRQVTCEYCELQLPHCDLAAHLEFCGTRTEACPRCGNFIMHKDLQRHNSSNCAYPEVKPPAPASETNGFRDRGGGDDLFGIGRNAGPFGQGGFDDSFDPYVFEEIRRALEGDADGRGMPNMVEVDSDASAAAGAGSEWGRRGRGGRMDRNPALPERKKNDTRGGRGTRKTTTNRRSEINRQRERASSPAIPPDMDYDAMLAMQLAEENDDRGTETDPFPDPDADLNQLISNFGKRSRQHQQRHEPMEQDDPTMSSGPPGYDELAAADEDMIPCEFCGETFPAFAVVHHQSVCDPLASGLWGQGPGFGRNNEPSFHHRTPAASRPPAIPVINNLGSASPAPDHEEEALRHLSDNGDFLLNSLENIMLPCEFCNDLLPADSLVQHQAMCERVPPTPRVMTPAAAQPSSGILPATERSLRSQFFPTSTSTSRYQPQDPTEELMAVISRGGQDSSSNVRPKKKPNVPRGGNPWENSGMSLSVARPQGSPPAQRRVNQGREPEDEQDIPLHGRRGSRPSQPRMDSANRIRHTLNSLLSDEGEENQGVAGAGGAVASGPGRRSQGSQKKTTSARDTGVSSRTVIRSLQQGQRQSRGELTPGGEGDLNSRRPSQRERGDHVFNNPGSQRNPASQTRSRRNQDRQPPADWE